MSSLEYLIEQIFSGHHRQWEKEIAKARELFKLEKEQAYLDGYNEGLKKATEIVNNFFDNESTD
jgi:flagellar biosynthesis/type III secretory pathway protein FliH